MVLQRNPTRLPSPLLRPMQPSLQAMPRPRRQPAMQRPPLRLMPRRQRVMPPPTRRLPPPQRAGNGNAGADAAVPADEPQSSSLPASSAHHTDASTSANDNPPDSDPIGALVK